MILCQRHMKRPAFHQKGYIQSRQSAWPKTKAKPHLFFLPLHALIRKYPYGVISEKERWTTGLVCPLHVRGICLAMFPWTKLTVLKWKILVEDWNCHAEDERWFLLSPSLSCPGLRRSWKKTSNARQKSIKQMRWENGVQDMIISTVAYIKGKIAV